MCEGNVVRARDTKKGDKFWLNPGVMVEALEDTYLIGGTTVGMTLKVLGGEHPRMIGRTYADFRYPGNNEVEMIA